jgi:RNA polymerase sigma-70 factor (ECF subfamily)
MRMETSDENLVAMALTGDADAFGTLVSRHYDLIFRLGFRFLGNRAEAEDLAQDICVSLTTKLPSFRAEAKFSTWLYRVCVNAAKDRVRKRQSRAKAARGWGDVEQITRAAATEAQAEQRWLQQALSTLPPDLLETVSLVLGEDMTHKQAAEVLNLTEGTISWRMSEVKKHLRAIAEAEERYP